jgi:hypothetical protein
LVKFDLVVDFFDGFQPIQYTHDIEIYCANGVNKRISNRTLGTQIIYFIDPKSRQYLLGPFLVEVGQFYELYIVFDTKELQVLEFGHDGVARDPIHFVVLT